MTTHSKDANAWVVRLHSGKLSARDRVALDQWLSASPGHSREFLRAETVWRLSGGFAHDEQIRRELDAILARTLPVSGINRRPFRIAARVAALVAIPVLGALAWQMFAHGHSMVYETIAGEQRSVALPDGSALTLNTGSRVRVRYDEHERTLQLERGEVIFQVTKDARRPFVVQAGPGIVRALGTRFDVMLDEQRAVTVAVLDGSVELITRGVAPQLPSQSADDASGAARISTGSVLRAGESAAYESSGLRVRANPEHASFERINAWHDGKLQFDSWSLLDAVREHNRYAIKPIRFGTPELEDLKVSGVFRVGDTAALLNALNRLLNIQAVDQGDAIVLTRASGNGPDTRQHP